MRTNARRYRSIPINRFNRLGSRAVGNSIARRLPAELQLRINRNAGRSAHRMRQFQVNRQIRSRVRHFRPVATSSFY